MKPRVSATDKVHSLERLDSIINVVRRGDATFEQAVAYFSQDKSTAMNAGLMTNSSTGSSKFEYQDLPPEIAKQIYTLKEGDISQPFVMMDQAKNKEVCAVVKLKTKKEVHRANMVDDYQTIRSMLEQKLSAQYILDWIKRKQKETYIFIDEHWRGCDFEYPGWIHEE